MYKPMIETEHEYLIYNKRVKEAFPDMQLGREVLKELNNHFYLMAVKAIERAKANKRTRVFVHDL